MNLNRQYETLDEYLDDLDAIKAKIAEETAGMTTEQVIAYFAAAKKRLYEKTGIKLPRPKPKRQRAKAKR